ncbi:putative FAST kinase domain-containing protein [Daphnia magna]|uniref:Putative FAST kinase domain-containing protein n=1 Tax=Daphnia magna TaxID=35525 RepID=A0A164LWC5_9CRUS|nr:putative FAST kinase domain-containing protein [Daphnia magna]
MDHVIKKILPQILVTHQKYFRSLGGCYYLSSKTVLSNMALLLKSGDKEDCIPENNDPFRLLLDSNLIHKKSITKCHSLTLHNGSILPNMEHFSKNKSHYEELIEWIDKPDFDIKSEKFKTLISGMLENLHLISGEHLVNIINRLCLNGEKTKQVECLVAKLDQKCCDNSRKWDKSIYIAAAWSFFQLKSYSAFNLQKKMVMDLAGVVKQMSSQELIMYLVILKQFRRFPRKINKADIEIRLNEVLDNVSIEDLGLACLAFFECNEAVQNTELVGRLVERLLIDANSTDEKTVGSMLKLFRRSSTDSGNFAKQVLDIQPRLCDLVHRWNPKVLIQLIAVGSNILFFHHATIERVARKILTCLNEARLKDLERLAMAIAISCHQSPSDFSDQSSYNSTKRELLLVNCSLNIEMPGYDGPRLCTNDAQTFEKLYRKPIPSVEKGNNFTNHEAFLLLLLDTVRKILGEKNSASLVYLQPHFVTPDIVFKMDGHDEKNTVMSYGNCKVQRFALIGGSRNMYSRFSDHPMGPLSMKIRQIETMGYRVIVIPWFEFLKRSKSDRLALISHRIRLKINDRKI